ncbi:MAG TPA: hypothetical protein VEK77_13830 [Gemmatimonadales bacterium]|nr:hypothetical protein [Gemmatimonadales bacterium]
MASGLRGGGAVPGPIGSRLGEKNQNASWFRPPQFEEWAHVPRQLVAQIYFPTGRHRSDAPLDGNDQDVLAKLARHYRETIAVGRKPTLVFDGYADERGEPGFNMDLSRARAEAVRNVVALLLVDLGPEAAKLEAFGERFAGRRWADDRRVDVFELTPWNEPLADPSQYSLEYLKENQQFFRLPIFERWHPKWALWRPLRDVLRRYEEQEHIHGGSEQTIPFQAGDLDQMAALLNKIAPDVMRRIENEPAGREREQALREAFFVEYRNAYPEAHDAAVREWEQSGIKSFPEFLTSRLGMLKPSAPRP